jgi:hypothetical protein
VLRGHQAGGAMDVQPVLRVVAPVFVCEPALWRAPGAACIAYSRRKEMHVIYITQPCAGFHWAPQKWPCRCAG